MATRRSAAPPAEPLEGDDTPTQPWGVVLPPSGTVGDFVTDDEEESESPLERVIASIRDAAGADRAKVKVYRTAPNSPQLIWCADYSLSEWESGGLPMLRAQWGAGDYELRIYGPNPRTGKHGVITKQSLTLAAPVAGAVAQVAAPAADPTLRALLESQQAILQALTNRPDPSAQMRETLQTMMLMREAMGLTSAAPAAPVSAVSQLTEMMTAFRTMREMSAELTPPKEPESEMGQLLSAAGPILEVLKETVLKKNDSAAPLPGIVPPPSLAAPVVANPQPSTETDVHPEGQQPMTMQVLKQELARLVQMAEQKRPVDEVAEEVADRLPDELVDFMQLPTWFDLLSAAAPEVKPHEEWFRALGAKVVELLFEPGPDDDSPSVD